MSEKEKQELLEQINKLTPIEFSNLCLKVVKKIVKRKPIEETIENRIKKSDKDVLIKLMIKNNIKLDNNNEF